MLTSRSALVAVFVFANAAKAHLAAFHEAMYCLNGASGLVDLNSNDIVNPLYQLPFVGWWFHGYDGCNKFPPEANKTLELPAGGSFMVEIASNRAKTTLSYNGRYTSAWPDGQTYPEDYNVPTCIVSPNMHTQNQTRAAGTAFAISYNSDINQVTPENLVVFSVRYNTPWKRITNYDVPKDMPACPPGGCICAWGWVPNGCGQPNIYQTPFKCNVTNAQSTTPLAVPKPPVWCEGNPGACTKGAKQMVYWNQIEGNNIQVSGFDAAGDPKSPGYNMKLGFVDGAQNDIFSGPPSGGSGTPTPAGGSPTSGSALNSGGGTGNSQGNSGVASSSPPKTAGSASNASPSTAPGMTTSGSTATVGGWKPSPTSAVPSPPKAAGSASNASPSLAPGTTTSGSDWNPSPASGASSVASSSSPEGAELASNPNPSPSPVVTTASGSTATIGSMNSSPTSAVPSPPQEGGTASIASPSTAPGTTTSGSTATVGGSPASAVSSVASSSPPKRASCRRRPPQNGKMQMKRALEGHHHARKRAF